MAFTREHRNTQTDLGKNNFLNTKDNEFNSAAISLLWHAPPNVLSETNYFCMKEYTRSTFFITQETTHYRLPNGTILKLLLMFPHNDWCMQKVASVTCMPFLKIHKVTTRTANSMAHRPTYIHTYIHLFIINPEGSMIHQYYKISLKTQFSSR